ncbi:hypothetical protein D3C78_1518260 [compost metagenome]
MASCSCSAMVARAVPSCEIGVPVMGAREGEGDAALSSKEGAADTGLFNRDLPCPSSKPSLRGVA